MRPRVVRSWLLALLAVASPAFAQDPVEYLIEGRDQRRGVFEGRYEVTPGADGVSLRRTATFRDGQEQQQGKGRRQGAVLRVELPATPGLSGSITPNQPQPPTKVEARFSDADAAVSSKLTKGSTQVARETGARVDAPFGTGTPDPTKRPTPEGAHHAYGRVVGVPFIKGTGDAHEVDINDVKQGGLGDCYFMAGLAAVARSQPERIRAMIHDHGDGTFSVYAWRHNDQWEEEVEEYSRTAIRIRLDDQFPLSGSSPAYAETTGDTDVANGVTRQELWPMLFEKAYAQFKGSYPGIEGGWASTSMSFFGAETVDDHTPEDMTEAQLKALLEKANKEGRPISMGVPTSNHSLGIHGEHYYAFWGFDAEGRALLYNPWGSSHPSRGLTMAEIRANIDSIHVGPR